MRHLELGKRPALRLRAAAIARLGDTAGHTEDRTGQHTQDHFLHDLKLHWPKFEPRRAQHERTTLCGRRSSARTVSWQSSQRLKCRSIALDLWIAPIWRHSSRVRRELRIVEAASEFVRRIATVGNAEMRRVIYRPCLDCLGNKLAASDLLGCPPCPRLKSLSVWNSHSLSLARRRS